MKTAAEVAKAIEDAVTAASIPEIQYSATDSSITNENAVVDAIKAAANSVSEVSDGSFELTYPAKLTVDPAPDATNKGTAKYDITVKKEADSSTSTANITLEIPATGSTTPDPDEGSEG